MDRIELELQAAAEELTGALREARGAEPVLVDRLKRALRAAAEAWAESDTISRTAANLFVDLAPSIDAISYAYKGDRATSIRGLAVEIADLVRECVALP